MSTGSRALVRTLNALAPALLAAPATATELLHALHWDHQSSVPSLHAPSASVSVEAADDFDLIGAVERVSLDTRSCSSCLPPTVTGVWVRFYAWTPTEPGALQLEVRVDAGDPRFVWDAFGLNGLEVSLPVPFVAQGKHFVSVQLETATDATFGVGTANWAAPVDAPARWRDRAAGGPWLTYTTIIGPVISDLAISLWGTDLTPPPPSSDPCGTWEELPVPDYPSAKDFKLTDVFVVGEDEVWATGEALVQYAWQSYKNLATTLRFDGASWTIVPTPNPEPYTNAGGVYLDVIAGSGADDLWAAGMQRKQNGGGFLGPQILAMRWDGSQWSVMNTPIPQDGNSYVLDLEVVAANDVWFVGEWATGKALAMRWNGSSFTVHPTPQVGGSGNALEAVSAVSATDVWAVGGAGDGDPGAQPYVLHWDGGSWSYVSVPAQGTSHRFYDVEALASDDVWITGTARLHWDGSTWTQYPVTGGGLDLHAYGPADVYAAGSGVFRWDGAAWSKVEDFHDVDSVTLASIDASSPCATHAVGRKLVAGLLRPFAARIQPTVGLEYCSGDGSASACPCANAGYPRHGCGHSTNGEGGRLYAQGVASVSADSLVLRAESLPPTTTVIFVQGTGEQNGGAGVALGDGLSCVAGTPLRLAVRPVAGGTTAFGHGIGSDPDVSVAGQLPAAGGTRTYQVWYRDAQAYCTGATYNLSNGVRVVYAP